MRDLPRDAQNHPDVVVRRAAARALARILDGDDAPLLRALDDEDDEVVAWASYGLGESCQGREDRHVRALAARLATLSPGVRRSSIPLGLAAGSSPRVPGRAALATLIRALGRCGGDAAETTLRTTISWGRDAGEAAAYALGDIVTREGTLSREAAVALLDAALSPTPLDAALFPFGRGDVTPTPGLGGRLATAARAALGRPGPYRLFAVRALSRTDDAHASADLSSILLSEQATPAERIEAARGLARTSGGMKGALADAVAAMVDSHLQPWAGDDFGVLLSAVDDLEADVPPRTEAALWSLARLHPGHGADAAALRRVSALRCAAATHLARRDWEADILRGCDLGDGEAGERARLTSLAGAWMDHARRAAWGELTRSPHVRVREAAIEAIPRHPELGDVARDALVSALTAREPGLVATAAKAVPSHPEAPLDARIAGALALALARPWGTDLIETRSALIEAGLASGIAEGRAYALKSCSDPNATIRAHAARALAAAGHSASACGSAAVADEPAASAAGEAVRTTRVVFDADAGSVSVTFDPAFAPVAVSRFVSLARSGFYTGVSFHRVRPGFVVQFGDPGGDGYGGSGASLRCETAPVSFEPLDVGVALAGRDTGSSQLFVTLARYPHLDGQYSWVGHAQGDWDAIAEGDVIRTVHVED
jgi:cyclophilin family peptidyl-prolyl cis-trans isomerase